MFCLFESESQNEIPSFIRKTKLFKFLLSKQRLYVLSALDQSFVFGEMRNLSLFSYDLLTTKNHISNQTNKKICGFSTFEQVDRKSGFLFGKSKCYFISYMKMTMLNVNFVCFDRAFRADDFHGDPFECCVDAIQ